MTLARVMGTAVLLGVLFQRIAIGEVVQVLVAAAGRWPLLLLAALLPAVGALLGAARWQTLLAAQRLRLTLFSLWKAILVGTYYNQFLPSSIGGDVVRSWWVTGRTGWTEPSTSRSGSLLLHLTVVAVDRLVGLMGLCVVAMLATLACPSLLQASPYALGIFACLATALGLVALLPYMPSTAVGSWLFTLKPLRRLRAKADTIYSALAAYRERKLQLLRALLLSLLLQMLIILKYVVLAAALRINVSIWALFILVPIVTLVSLLPVTINGIGLRENTLIVLGAPLGLGPSAAVALAWAVLATTLVSAFLGGVICLRGRGVETLVEPGSCPLRTDR